MAVPKRDGWTTDYDLVLAGIEIPRKKESYPRYSDETLFVNAKRQDLGGIEGLKRLHDHQNYDDHHHQKRRFIHQAPEFFCAWALSGGKFAL